MRHEMMGRFTGVAAVIIRGNAAVRIRGPGVPECSVAAVFFFGCLSDTCPLS